MLLPASLQWSVDSLSEVATNMHRAFETLRDGVDLIEEGIEMQNDAAATRLEIERALGALLATINMEPLQGISPLLADIGITPEQAHCWQQEASVSTEEFERFIITMRATGKEITSAGLIRLSKELKWAENQLPGSRKQDD